MKMEKLILKISLVFFPLVITAAENLIINGGFENDTVCWSYEEWRGLPPPGQISEEKPYEGKKCFVLTEPGKMCTRFIRTNSVPVDRNRDYIFRIALSPRNIVAGSIKVRILQFGAKAGKKTPVLGWLSKGKPGSFELLPDIKGTSDWQVYEICFSGSELKPQTQTVSVFIHQDNPGLGELKIDAVELQIRK